LTARFTNQAEIFCRPYWPDGTEWKGHRLTDKSHARDNRLIASKSTYRWSILAPRCWLVLSSGCTRSEGYGCSPFKRVRELSSERRKTVRFISSRFVRNWETLTLVREDWVNSAYGLPVVSKRHACQLRRKKSTAECI